jgi:ribosomal protein L37AE/L43A
MKENGRFIKAEKEELAGLKGKPMVCPSCGTELFIINAKFGDMNCRSCGAKLIDKDMAQASKLTGKR